MKKWIFLFYAISVFASCGRNANNQATEAPKSAEIDEPSENLIVGGRNVTKKSEIAATTVSLLNLDEGSLCTASILSEEIAITAAHCLSDSLGQMQLAFGVNSVSDETRPISAAVASPVWRARQNQMTDNGDIALVRFEGGLPKFAKPATVMKTSHKLTNGETVTLAGFGISDPKNDKGAGRLRMVDVKIQNARYSQTEVSLDQSNRKGACHGDSGGPAFIQDNQGLLLLWGVTSRGINDPSDLCRGQAVYTRIQPYSRWINSVIRSWK